MARAQPGSSDECWFRTLPHEPLGLMDDTFTVCIDNNEQIPGGQPCTHITSRGHGE